LAGSPDWVANSLARHVLEADFWPASLKVMGA